MKHFLQKKTIAKARYVIYGLLFLVFLLGCKKVETVFFSQNTPTEGPTPTSSLVVMPTATPTVTPEPTATPEPTPTPTPAPTPTPEPTPTPSESQGLTYEEYNALDADAQKAYYESFANVADFFAWYNQAKAEHEQKNPPIIIGGGSINLEEILNGKNGE